MRRCTRDSVSATVLVTGRLQGRRDERRGQPLGRIAVLKDEARDAAALLPVGTEVVASAR